MTVIEYPFDDSGYVYLSREVFNLFAEHFEFVPFEPKPGQENDIHTIGYRAFEYDASKIKTEGLDEKALCELGLMIFGYYKGFTKCTKLNFTKEAVNFLKTNGITGDVFLKHMTEFEYPELGEESAQIIAMFGAMLDEDAHHYVYFRSAAMSFDNLKKRYKTYTELFRQFNREAEPPYTLDAVLDFEHTPVTLRHDSAGFLYVLDRAGRLREFDRNQETGSWVLPLDSAARNGFAGLDRLSMISIETMPNIAVEDRVAYLTSGFGLLKYVLDELDPEEIDDEYIGTRALVLKKGVSSLTNYDPNKRPNFHDVLIKDGNVIVSTSKDESRQIIQVTEDGPLQIYSGRFPVGFVRGSWDDLTLRLGLHRGGLYFPRSTGMSLFTGAQPKEMLADYVDEESEFNSVNPITKFSFGDDFMVGVVTLKDIELPMLCIFNPVYKESSGEDIVPAGELPHPESFRLSHCGYIPKMTAPVIYSASISAHGDSFAITNSTFNKVFVYKMRPAKD